MKSFFTDKTKKEMIQKEKISFFNDPELDKKMIIIRSESVFSNVVFSLALIILLGSVIIFPAADSYMLFFIIFFSVLFFILAGNIYQNKLLKIKKEVSKTDPDLVSLCGLTNKERIDIDEYGLSNIYFSSPGGRGSKDTYVRKMIRKSDIQEILYCSEMNVIILRGKVSVSVAGGTNIYKKEYSDWCSMGIYRSNLRLYDHWINHDSTSDDLLREISELFAFNIRYIGTDEALELIKNDQWSELKK